MRSAQLKLEQYNTDKVTSRCLERYDPILEPWLDKKITLLELGVLEGGSLLLWHDYFPQATIVGVDINPSRDFDPSERIHIYKGSQADPEFLSRMANEIAPDGFDIIIDDASHIGEFTKAAFWHLFDNHLKPHGLYVIEDWGTGYWDDFIDGKSLDFRAYLQRGLSKSLLWTKIKEKLGIKTSWPCHNFGMVGFIKQLVDEQGAPDVTRKRWLNGKPTRSSKFESITIVPSIVFIRKAPSQPKVD